MLRALFAIACAGLLAGCATLTAIGDVTTPLDVYEISAPADGPQARGQPTARDLIVELPTARGALDTDRIMIRPNPLQAQYLPRARWGESTPTMVQTLLVRSFEDTNAFRYVGRRPLGGSGDFALVSDVTDFHAELSEANDSVTVQLRVTARLVREEDARILAGRSFTANAAVQSTDSLNVVTGFDAAAKQLLTQITRWTLSTLSIPASGKKTAAHGRDGLPILPGPIPGRRQRFRRRSLRCHDARQGCRAAP